jgi:ABC-type branched-subunit amino acid transport system permease subunit
MTDELGGFGSIFGAVIGAGVTLLAIDILFNRDTGKYYHRQTGEEIPKEKAEKVLGKVF